MGWFRHGRLKINLFFLERKFQFEVVNHIAVACLAEMELVQSVRNHLGQVADVAALFHTADELLELSFELLFHITKVL